MTASNGIAGGVGRHYYIKRAGRRWEVWFANADGRPDPHSGAWEWRATVQRFWTWKAAARVASDMQVTFADGVWSSRLAAAAEVDARVEAMRER